MMQIDRQLFRSTLLEEVRAAWKVLRQAHPHERFYSFGIYTTAAVDYLMVTASTEKGLSDVTAEYCRKYGGDEALRRSSLRWSPPDSPIHREGQGLLARSETLRRQGPDPYDDCSESDEAVSMIFDVAVEVLRQLDAAGLFGSDLERGNLVLGIWAGDQSDRERIEYAQALNPSWVARRFNVELDKGACAFVALSQSNIS